MKAVVIYDSAFGNTEQIAKKIADAIGPSEVVRLFRVSDVIPEQLQWSELLIVGSPTQGFRATKPIQTFIESLSKDALKGLDVAAFDTRMPTAEVGTGLRLMMKMGGYAAPRIANALKKKGGNLIAPPEGFFVKDKEGPVEKGELERAASWAKSLCTQQTE